MKKLVQRLKRRRKNSGFTLVEMVISCGLLGILVLGVTLFITPVLKSAASDERNVRASLLAETVNNFVSRTTRAACYVQIFTNADRKDAYDGGKIATNENLKKMLEYTQKRLDPEGKRIYELKCISFTWAEDTQTFQHKYMVMSETFANVSSTAINANPIPMFENCFYDGLFPKFTAEQLKGTDVAPGDESADPSKPDDKKPVPAMKLTTEVFSDQEMKAPEFIGVGYTEYASIKNPQINPSGDLRFFEPVSLDSKDDHSSTFIFYVGRKSMAAEAKP